MAERKGATTPLPAFAVDKMLGRLARWLRILGHDVCWGPELRGRALAARARREHRLLLTRDTRLVRERNLPPHLFVTSDHFREQLRQVAAVVPLGGGFLHRCVACNMAVVPTSRDAAAPRVPPYVLATQERFHECPRCRRIYWSATHRDRILEELARIGLVPAAAGSA
jgi:uncharacterized protein with PIN domain